MAFLALFLAGLAGGVLGGMGMGGGTALIPILTVLCGVEQRTAQGLNLLSFLPMSVAALCVHLKNGLVKREGVLPIALPALLVSALFSLAAAALPSRLLKKLFGSFLVVLALLRAKKIFAAKRKKKFAEFSKRV